MSQQKNDLAHRYVKLSFTRPFWVLGALLLLAAAGLGLASRLAFRGSFVELLPKDTREVRDLEQVAQKAGGDGYLVLQTHGAELQTLTAYAHAVAPKLEALPEIRYVEYRYDIGFFEERGLWLLPAEKLAELHDDLQDRIRYEKQAKNPLFVDLLDEPPPSFEQIERRYAGDLPQSEYLVAQDGSELYLFVKPNGTPGDLGFTRRLLSVTGVVLDETAKDFPGVQTGMAGQFPTRLSEDEVMRRDLAFASLLSAALAALLVLLGTRRASGLLVVGTPVVLGLALTFAVAQLAVGHLNIVTGFLVAILIGLGIEYGVHLGMRYWEERRVVSAQEAMERAVRGTFRGALISAGTNAAAFFVLLFADFQAFAQFGFIAGTGVVLAVLAAYAVGPAVVAVAERVRPQKPLPQEKVRNIEARQYRRMPTGLVAAVLAGIVGFGAYSVVALPKLGFETDLTKLRGETDVTRLNDHMVEKLRVQINPAIVWVEDLEAVRAVTKAVEDLREEHGEGAAILRTASLADLVPEDLDARGAQMARLRTLLDDLPPSVREGATGQKVQSLQTLLEAKPWTAEEVPQTLRRRFVPLDGEGLFVLLFPKHSQHETENLHRWATQVGELISRVEADGGSLHVLDSNLIAARVFDLVEADGPFILWAAALVVFVMIAAGLRSLKHAGLVAGPLFLGMLCLGGAMHLFGIRLNFINAVVLPNLLAVAVDNGVHLYHRYRQEGPGSLGHVVRHTGGAAALASLANAAGYGALLSATHPGLASIGHLAVLGVICTFLGTGVFLPALLTGVERWRVYRGVLQLPAPAGSTVLPLPAAPAPELPAPPADAPTERPDERRIA